ncbi:hypothetical protein E2C01_044881 [Portunus trituberculatus]|uniref:Uncharacterized protein n=1 Tax=Portunus trituberculatus TaxID=210409 RepID=A0A5B7G3J0_PORTR|nr:hypothetical protein [Portunus trituberculatus]
MSITACDSSDVMRSQLETPHCHCPELVSLNLRASDLLGIQPGCVTGLNMAEDVSIAKEERRLLDFPITMK